MGFISREQKNHTKFILTPNSNKTAIVPVHGNKDIKKGTFLAILKQAGVKI